MSKIDLFRLIDRWAGVPLCFIFSLLVPLKRWRLRFFQRSSHGPRKILVIKLIEIGAVIHAYPFFNKIQKDFPGTDIYVLTFSKNKEIFELFNDSIKFKQIITIKENSFLSVIMDSLRALWLISFIKMDMCVDLEFFSRASALLAFFSGTPTTVGFFAYGYEGLYRGNFLTHQVPYNPLSHTAINYLSLADALQKDFKNSPDASRLIEKSSLIFPQYRSIDEVRRSLDSFNIPQNKRVFLMNLGEGNISLREWPLPNFKIVAEAVLKNENHVLFLVGTNDSRKKADELMGQVQHQGMFNYCGQTSLRQLMEIFLISDILIANDGGMGHLAMLTPIRKFILYGPETPRVFSPLGTNTQIFYSHWPCSPCLSALNHRNSSCRDNKCLQAINPQEVITAIENNLNSLETI